MVSQIISNIMSPELSPFDKCKAQIYGLAGGAYKGLEWQVIRDALDEITDGHLFVGYTVPKGTIFFRGRLFRTDTLKSNKVELLERNYEEVKEYGRCHRPKTSVLYAAKNWDTILAELDVFKGDFAQIICLEVIKPFYIFIVGDIEHCRRFEHSMFPQGNYNYEMSQEIKGILETNDIQKILVDAFMSDVFSKSDRGQAHYRLTSALADILLNNGHQDCIGFAYPSVAHRGGVNFAFKSSEYSKYMVAKNCEAIKITDDLGYGLYGRNTYAIANGFGEDGTINWEINSKSHTHSPR